MPDDTERFSIEEEERERYFPIDPLREEEVLAILEERAQPISEAQPTHTPKVQPISRKWTYDEMYEAIRADSEYLVEAWKKFPGGKGVDTKKLLEAVNAGRYPAPKETQ